MLYGFCFLFLFWVIEDNEQMCFLNTAFLWKYHNSLWGMEKKLHHSLPMGFFSLNRFSVLCLVFHFEKMNIQLKSSLTIIITKYFSLSLAWKQIVLQFVMAEVIWALKVHACVTVRKKKNFLQKLTGHLYLSPAQSRHRSVSCSDLLRSNLVTSTDRDSTAVLWQPFQYLNTS